MQLANKLTEQHLDMINLIKQFKIRSLLQMHLFFNTSFVSFVTLCIKLIPDKHTSANITKIHSDVLCFTPHCMAYTIVSQNTSPHFFFE